ncbi:MAG: hypothetical protein PHQ90_11990 [Sulfuricurvum sp.]|uniref:hypothetical protein n=1 Tax=Sulfuricurvum sp. TaxID=2025608 RepID=UPI00261556B7|nr:hypothetical protein [Sulfuricurvum sp.]MDD2370013.1 hypothetical protein [Sulfuricurvum sp.]MDD5117937.1 hypothetical protein [Sulfuricurvum sp.]
MNLLHSITDRLIRSIRCFGKRRYGYLDHSSCHIPSGSEALVLILSPDLYRICVVSLPVATPKEAVRYAPSYFDLSDERTRYGAYQLGEGRYLLSAFDPEPIRVRLEEAGVDPVSVERFVLAQEAFGVDILPVSLKNGSVLALNDGIVVRLPSEYIGEPPKYDLEVSLQKLAPCLTGFRADMYKGGDVTKKTLTITLSLSLIILLNLLIQGGYSYREAGKIADEQEQMKIEKNLPATQMELDALASSWEKKESQQMKLRKIFAAFSTLTLENNNTVLPVAAPAPASNGIVLVPGSNPGDRNLLLVPGGSNTLSGTVSGEYVTSLAYENGSVHFKISTPSPQDAEKIRDSVAKTLKTNTVTIKENTVEGSIQ